MFLSPTILSSIPMKLVISLQLTISFCENIEAQLLIKSSTFSIFPFITHISFFLSENSLLILSIRHPLSFHSMTEMEWTQLGKKLGLKTRPEQKGKSLQLRYFRNLGLFCLQVSGFLFFFFQFSPHNAPSYTTLCYEIFPVKPSSSRCMVIYNSYNSLCCT